MPVTHAAEAATQETHCSCTRHVPRRVPRPCPCTTGVMKSTTDHLSAAATPAAEAATQETHCSCTRHVPRRVPRPCPCQQCTTGVMQSTTDHLCNQQIIYHVTHAAEAMAQKTHCSCTRHVPRRVPRPGPCTTGVMQSTTDHLLAATCATEATTQETHCNFTRHVPKSVPRP